MPTKAATPVLASAEPRYDRSRDTAKRVDKLRRALGSEITDLNTLDAEALNRKIVECQANLVETERERDRDADLAKAKNSVANLSAPYREAKTRLTNVATYCTLRLEELGK